MAQDVTLTYQGTLNDAAGAPVTGTRNVTYALYITATGGSPVWQEQHDGVDVLDGSFSSVLGSRTALEGDIAAEPMLYLGVTLMAIRNSHLECGWAAPCGHNGQRLPTMPETYVMKIFTRAQ